MSREVELAIMGDQEIFNQVYLGLKAQGFKCSQSSSGYGCVYRGTDGRKCAVGHLIPDELFNENLNTESVRLVEVQRMLPFPVTGDNFLLLIDLQNAHDGGLDPEYMDICLRDVADGYGLEVPND
jgi:hypothetical protein